MCPYEEKLTAWLLGDLGPEEHEGVTRHLATCAECRSVRDELAPVLTPLKSGLAKDDRLIRRTSTPNRLQTLFHAPWIRAAALFLVSFTTLFALFGLFYNAATTQKISLGPITTFTFHKGEQPPEPLESFPPATDTTDAFAMTFEHNIPLPDIVDIYVPDIPMHDYSSPHFFTLAQIALWAPHSNSPPIIYNDLLALQFSSTTATNDAIPILLPPQKIYARPRQ